MNEVKNNFNQVYDDTYETILKYIIAKTDNLSNVEDIIQNVYITFYETISTKGTDYIDNELAYLIKICKSELFKYYTIKNKIKCIFNINSENEKDIPNQHIDLEREVVNKIELEQIWNLIKKEDLLTGKIMALYFQNDMKIKDIAIMLNVSEANVKNRIYRTLSKIKKRFGGINKNE